MRGAFRYPATILFSAKTEKDIFELGHFKFLEKKYRNFKFIPTLTREKHEGYKSDRVTDLLPKLYSDLAYYSIYIAGSNSFVNDVSIVIRSLGAKEENIHIERFISVN
jgi:CDP-4-dehydro-6-deoxyglucose reductase